MAMRDIKLPSQLSKNIYLSHDLALLEAEALGLEVLIKMLACSVQIISHPDSQSKLKMFALQCSGTKLMHHRGAPTFRFHTGLCKFLRNIWTNICSLGKRKRLAQTSFLIRLVFVNFIH